MIARREQRSKYAAEIEKKTKALVSYRLTDALSMILSRFMLTPPMPIPTIRLLVNLCETPAIP
jgi:hypothetical protein